MSDLKTEMSDFLTHENQHVRECAKRVHDLASLLEANEISEDEFNELVGDVTDVARVAESAEDIEWKANVETGLRALIAIMPKVVGLATGK